MGGGCCRAVDDLVKFAHQEPGDPSRSSTWGNQCYRCGVHLGLAVGGVSDHRPKRSSGFAWTFEHHIITEGLKKAAVGGFSGGSFAHLRFCAMRCREW